MTDDPGRRKAGRFIAILSATILGVAVAAALVNEPALERALAGLAGRLMSSPGRTVMVEDLRPAWPLAVTVGTVDIRDGQGTWLRIADLHLAVSPKSLLAGRLTVAELTAKSVEILRPPRTEAKAAPSHPLDWLTALPGGLRLGHVDLPVTLAAPVLGVPTRLVVTGTETKNTVFSLHVAADDGSHLSLTGRAVGRSLDLSWGAHAPDLARWAALANVKASGRFDARGTIVGAARRPTITAKASVGPGRVGSWREMGLVGDLAADIDFATGRIVLARATVGDGAADLVASGIMMGWGRDSHLSGRLHIKNLTRLVGRQMAGGATFDLTLAGDLPAGVMRLDVTGGTEGLITGNGVVDRLLGPRPSLHAVLSVAPGGHVRLTSGRIVAAGGTLDAAGAVAPHLSLRGDMDMPTLAWAEKGLAGHVRIGGQLTDSIYKYMFHGQADLTGVGVAGMPPLTGRIGIAGGEALRLDPIAVTAKETRIAGAVTIGKQGARGRLAVDVANLADWAGAIGIGASGAIHGAITLDPAQGQTMRLDGTADSLVVGNVTVGKISTRASVDHLTATSRFRIDARSQTASLAADGSLALASGGGSVDLDRFSIHAGRDRLGLIRPARLVWGPNVIMAAPLALSVDHGRLEVEGGLRDGRLAVRARMKTVPLAMAGAMVPRITARGIVDGTATVGGTLAQPDGHITVSGRDLGWGGAVGAVVAGIDAKADLSLNRGRVDGVIEAHSGNRFQATARFSVPWKRRAAAPVSGRLHLNGDIGALSAALPLGGTAVGGRVLADVTLGGRVGAPRWGGRASIANGRIDYFATGTLLSKVSATALLAGDRVTVTGAGGDGGSGRVAVDGTATLSGAYDAKAVLTNFRILSSAEGEASASGTLAVAGTGRQGRVSGELTVDRAELDVGRLVGGGPPSLDVVEVDGKGHPITRSSAPVPPSPPLPLALDVGVAVHHAYVRGRGLESEWQGKIKATGRLDKPVLTGALNPVRGRYDLFGRAFTLSPASAVTFTGGSAVNPLLDVSAQTKTQDIVATILVGGSADHPSVSITSTPPLPKEEILARLLFGKDVGTLTTFQQLQLAQMAAVGLGLGGGNGGFNPLADLRNLLGLDMLEVGGGQGGTASGPTLSLGKYIGPDTFVRVEQGMQGVGRVQLEENVGHGLSVTTGIGDQSGGSVGFTWKRDY